MTHAYIIWMENMEGRNTPAGGKKIEESDLNDLYQAHELMS